MTKIIVLTPVKNEDWILDQFLTVTSQFADCIIIADQQSTDASRSICSRFPKVHLIDNDNNEFCEDDRQILLIETARKLFPDDKRILFGLDADELFSADSLRCTDTWKRIKELKPGTSLYLERSDMFVENNKCVRAHNHDQYFPLGYIDDGIAHKPNAIHSRRVPENKAGENIYLDDIKIMHFLYSRMNVRFAKMRYYSVVENIKRSSSFYIRRFAYSKKEAQGENQFDRTQNIPENWLQGWQNLNINLTHFHEPDYAWHDFEVLRYFKHYGYRRFYFDDIWDFNWDACLQRANASGREIPLSPIRKPARVITSGLKIIDQLYVLSRKLRSK